MPEAAVGDRQPHVPVPAGGRTRTPVPAGVWTRALSSRIRSTCATRSGSQSSSIGSSAAPARPSESWRCAAGVNSPATSRASWPTSVGSGRSSSAPASSRDRSSSSVASLRRRSTWPRSCSRNWRRVSSSRSSSASSSRKPPSEKIGVRSSCDAVAMNCLRARSSRASWRCMSSNAARELAELVVGVGADRAREVARRDLARGALEPPDALRRARAPRGSRPSTRDHERDAAGDQDLAADQRDVALDLVERVGEHRDADDLLALRSAARATSAWRPRSTCSVAVAGRPAATASSATRADVVVVEAAVRRGVHVGRRPQCQRPVAPVEDAAPRALAPSAARPTELFDSRPLGVRRRRPTVREAGGAVDVTLRVGQQARRASGRAAAPRAAARR